jgi:hypothetical protein
MKGLWKSTIVIWSTFDPSEFDIEDLSRDALAGDAHCSEHKVEFIDDLDSDPDWDGSELLNDPDNEFENE